MLNSENEKLYTIIFMFTDAFADDVEFEVSSCEFSEPLEEDLLDISTTKQLLYYLAEIFGDNISTLSNQDEIELIEEHEISDISEMQIIDTEEQKTYCLNIQNKKIFIE